MDNESPKTDVPGQMMLPFPEGSCPVTCPDCGGPTVPSGTCRKCLNCGSTTGCS